MKTYEFGASLERVWIISKLTPKSFVFSKQTWKKNNKGKNTLKNEIIWVWSEFEVSLERVWKISKLTPNSFLSSPQTRWNKKKIWAWSEFGESLKNLQTHSKLIPLFQRNNEITINNENIWVRSELGESPNSLQTPQRNLCLMSFFKKQTKKRKNEFGESPKSFQTEKKMRAQLFLSGCTHYFFEKKLCTHIFLILERSLERVSRFSKLIFPLFFKKMKNDIKQKFLCEFGASLEWVWREFGESPNSQRNLCLMSFFKKKYFFSKKKGKKWVWRFSKLKKKICVHNFFLCLLSGCTHIFCEKESCARIFFWVWTEFAESLEVLQTHFFSSSLSKKIAKWHQAKISLWTWSDLQTLLQTRSKLICFSLFLFYFFLVYFCFFLKKEEWVWSEFGDSPNSLQTHMFSCFCYLLFFGQEEWVWRFSQTDSQIRSKLISFHVFSILFFGEKRNEFGVSLEILQTLSKLIPNSLQTRMFSDFSVLFVLFYLLFILLLWEKGNEFGVSLGILQTHPKLKWLLFFSVCFPFIVILNIFFGEERNEFGVSLEVVQTLSRLTPNSLQTHMVSFCCFFFIVNLLFFSFFEKGNEFSFFPLSLLDLF